MREFKKNICGATAIEYCLIVAGIAMAISVFVFAIGSNMGSAYQSIEQALAGFAGGD